MSEKPKLSLYFKKEKPLTFWIVVTGLLTNVLIIWIPVLQGYMIDSVLNAVGNLISIVLFFVGVVVLVQFLRFWKRYLVRKFENRTVREIRETIYGNILESSIDSMTQHTAGSLMNKIIGDVNIVSEGLRKIITEIFDTCVMLVGYIIIMCFADIRLTLLSCLFIPVGVTISKLLKAKVSYYNNIYREAKGDINDTIYQNVTHAVFFRLMGLQEQFGNAFKRQLPGLRKKAIKASFFDTGLTPLYNTIALLGVVFVIIYGARNVESGSWTIGQFSSFIVMFAAVARKSGMISTYITLWQKTYVSWARLKEHLELVAAAAEEGEAVSLTTPVSLKFENIGFEYENGDESTDKNIEKSTDKNTEKSTDKNTEKSKNESTDEQLIENLSFEATAGQIIGIAGPVASGKSTILKLLTTEKPVQGKVTINDLNVSTLSTRQKAEIIAYKPHESELFSGTIKENIIFDKETCPEPLLEGTALEHDLDTIANGLDTHIGAGLSILSGGQMDRISLARTLYTSKNIILLDDPFSALDTETEMHIMSYLRENFKDSVIIITSHRFGIFPLTDMMIFLDGAGGYIKGSHDELLEQNTLYSEIYNTQKGVM